jgi:hypothetical protein
MNPNWSMREKRIDETSNQGLGEAGRPAWTIAFRCERARREVGAETDRLVSHMTRDEQVEASKLIVSMEKGEVPQDRAEARIHELLSKARERDAEVS